MQIILEAIDQKFPVIEEPKNKKIEFYVGLGIGLSLLIGFISGLFVFFYSIFRFTIEFFRAPDEQLGYLLFNLTMGQLISFTFLLVGVYLMISRYEIKKES